MTQTAQAAPGRLHTVAEAAELLHVSKWQIYQLMRTDQLAYVQSRTGKGTLGYRKVEQAEIDRFIAANRVAP